MASKLGFFIFLVLTFAGCSKLSNLTFEDKIKLLDVKEKTLMAEKKIIGAKKELVVEKAKIAGLTVKKAPVVKKAPSTMNSIERLLKVVRK
jgi:beta-lactam-binding protein with PASTA domain